jgi:hypothetical protein
MPRSKTADYRPYALAVLTALRDLGGLEVLHADTLVAQLRISGGLTDTEIAETLGVPVEDITHPARPATAA